MRDLQKKTAELVEQFGSIKGKEYIFMDMVEEVGELATAILYMEKAKHGKLTGKVSKADVADALADILWDLFKIANEYEIDLQTEYKEMMDRLAQRVEAGEFD